MIDIYDVLDFPEVDPKTLPQTMEPRTDAIFYGAKSNDWFIEKQHIKDHEGNTRQKFVALYHMEHGKRIDWMNNLYYEVSAHEKFINECAGDVFVGGLGLGYDALSAAVKPEVTSVTVAESSLDVITMVAPYMKNDKIEIVYDRCSTYLAETGKKFDYIWFDIYPADPVYYPKETKILTELSERCLKPGGKIRFFTFMREIQI